MHFYFLFADVSVIEKGKNEKFSGALRQNFVVLKMVSFIFLHFCERAAAMHF